MSATPKTAWPKLVNGRTYRFTFTGTATGEPRGSGLWTVRDAPGQTAGAFRAYVMRWTRHGRNLATIDDVTDLPE